VVVLSAQGIGSKSLHSQVRLQDLPGKPLNLRSNRGSSGEIRRGTWVCWEVLLETRGPGRPEGSVRWWINGVETGNYDGVMFVRPEREASWEQVSWNPTYGGRGAPVPALQTMSIDNLIVSAAP